MLRAAQLGEHRAGILLGVHDSAARQRLCQGAAPSSTTRLRPSHISDIADKGICAAVKLQVFLHSMIINAQALALVMCRVILKLRVCCTSLQVSYPANSQQAGDALRIVSAGGTQAVRSLL